MTKATVFEATRNDLGEGCYWDARGGALWWTDIERSCVYQKAPGSAAVRHQLPGRAGFILPRRDGGYVIGFPKQIAVADATLKTFSIVGDLETQLPKTRANDATVDPWGGIVLGTFDETFDMDARRPIASLYRLGPDGDLTLLLEGITTSNGLAFSPAGDVMYFTDSAVGVIRRFNVGANFSSFDEISPLAELAVAPGRPDGGTVDAEGNYWSARVWGGCAVRLDGAGQVTAHIEIPTKGPTCLALGGADLKTLYVTTLSIRHTEAELEAAPDAGCVFQARVEVPGLPQRLCAL